MFQLLLVEMNHTDKSGKRVYVLPRNPIAIDARNFLIIGTNGETKLLHMYAQSPEHLRKLPDEVAIRYLALQRKISELRDTQIELLRKHESKLLPLTDADIEWIRKAKQERDRGKEL